jgi:hypothetical protein
MDMAKAMSCKRVMPRQTTMLPRGGSWLRARLHPMLTERGWSPPWTADRLMTPTTLAVVGIRFRSRLASALQGQEKPEDAYVINRPLRRRFSDRQSRQIAHSRDLPRGAVNWPCLQPRQVRPCGFERPYRILDGPCGVGAPASAPARCESAAALSADRRANRLRT